MLRKTFTSGLGVLVLIAACGQSTHRPPAPGSWPIFRGDAARDGHAPDATLTAGQAAHLRLLWRTHLDGSVDASAIVSGGRVIVGSQGGELVSLDATSGALRWRRSHLGGITASVAVDGQDVFVATLSGLVLDLALADGHPKWGWKAGGQMPAIWSTPTLFRDEVLVGIASQAGDRPLEAGAVVALSRDRGQVLWVLCTMPRCAQGGGVWSTPAIDASGRGFVGVGNPVDGVIAFDPSGGKLLWQTSFQADADRDLDVGATPVIFDLGSREVVGVGSDGGVFEVLDAVTGETVWSRNLVQGGAVQGLLASPAYDGSTLYVPSASPPTGMFALSARDGRTQWTSSTRLPIYSAPALGERVLLFGEGEAIGPTNSGRILALSVADHQVVWSYDTQSAVRSGPVVAGNLVVVGDFSGDVLAFRPNS